MVAVVLLLSYLHSKLVNLIRVDPPWPIYDPQSIVFRMLSDSEEHYSGHSVARAVVIDNTLSTAIRNSQDSYWDIIRRECVLTL